MIETILLPTTTVKDISTMLTNTDNAEFIPAPCTDLGKYPSKRTLLHFNNTSLIHKYSNIAGEAGSVWRTNRLSEYRFQLRQLGLEDDPAFASLFNQMQQHTDELEKLWEQQKQPDYQQHWWQDGEYDEERADQANEAGSHLFSQSKYSEAFEAFTEAIRLNPKSPVYLSNRASVALKLRNPAIAAEDAQHALKRDASYIKAAMRGGKAYLQLKLPNGAIEMYEKVLGVDGKNTAALKGWEEAKVMEKQQKQQAERDQQAATAGNRPAMPRTPVPRDDAVQQLLTATDMLEANPRLEAAKAAHVEALLLCGRYDDALVGCEALQLGAADTCYLLGEILWRRGNIDAAIIELEKEEDPTDKPVEKCVDLLAFLYTLKQLEAEIEEGWEVGQYQQCIEVCDAMLESVKHMDQVATGLYCRVLQRRGEAYAERQLWEEAMTDLNAALQADPFQANCLKTRAKVLQLMGRPTEAFLDLQKLKKVLPAMPGLSKLVEQAARLCLHEASNGSNDGTSSSSSKPAPGLIGGGTDIDHACCILGLRHQTSQSSSSLLPPSPSVITVSAVRKAYLSLASKWHPDKWTNADEEEKLHAEASFKEIQKAYELLTIT
jgi:tetratricopeptide (TPR) repeat protein